jgi:hypothetical protein
LTKPTTKKRSVPQTKSSPPLPKKKATRKSTRTIPQDLSEEEIVASVKKFVDSFIENLKKKKEERRNLPKPYFFLPLDHLRQTVDAH